MIAEALTSVLSEPTDRIEIEAPDPPITATPSETTLESKHG